MRSDGPLLYPNGDAVRQYVFDTARRRPRATGCWSRSQPDVLRQVGAPSPNPAKAWRWLAEMQEIAQTFESAGQPGGFAQAAAEICRRLESYKDDGSKPSIEKVVGAVRRRA